MTSVEWLLGKEGNPVGSDDFYGFYDEFCEEHGHVSMETFKRYCRSAMKEYKDRAFGSDIISTDKTDDGLVVKNLKSFKIVSEEDIRKQAHLSEEEWECSTFQTKSSSNEMNPWHSVNATFKKKKELTFPIIEQCFVSIPKFENTDRKPCDAIVNMSDLHAPFHDEHVMDVALQIIKDVYPKEVVLNGDFLDLTDFSDKFLASIECRNQTQEAINVVAKFIGQIRQVCHDTKIVFLEGNHSSRMSKAILKNVSAAVGLKRADNLEGYEALSVPNLLCLDSLEVEWQPYPEGEYWAGPNLRFHHGESLNLSKLANEITYNEIMGHNHKILLESRTKKVYDGRKQIFVASFGCMCKIDGSVPAVKSFMDWQQGFGVIYTDGENIQPVPVYVNDGKAFFEGQMYTSRL